MRRVKRISGTRLGAIVGMSQAKISRIERGAGVLHPAEVGAIARALGADEMQAQALMARAERSGDRMTDWRPASTGLAIQQKTLAGWESGASVVRAFEPTLVPGPLQTSGYASLVLRAFQNVLVLPDGERTEPGLAAAVTARVERQQAIADPEASFHFVMGEAALRRRAYPPVEMLAQINHLRNVVAEFSNVTVTIIPDGAPTEIPLVHGFFVFDEDRVVVDLYNTGLISRSPRDVQSYRRVFDLLAGAAVAVGPLLDRYESLYIDMLTKRERP